MNEPKASRFDAVRSQLRVTRRLATAGATVAFAAIAGLAWNSHPGASSNASSQSSGTVQSQTSDDSSSSFGFGSANVAPATGSSTGSAPSIQSSGS